MVTSFRQTANCDIVFMTIALRGERRARLARHGTCRQNPDQQQQRLDT
jgi:hypothetical protein